MIDKKELEHQIKETTISNPEGDKYTFKNILQFTDNDTQALQTIINSFIETTKDHIAKLGKLQKEQQWDEISKLAHKMLPLFRQLEVRNTTEKLEQLEHPDKACIGPNEISSLTITVIEQASALIEDIKRNEQAHK